MIVYWLQYVGRDIIKSYSQHLYLALIPGHPSMGENTCMSTIFKKSLNPTLPSLVVHVASQGNMTIVSLGLLIF